MLFQPKENCKEVLTSYIKENQEKLYRLVYGYVKDENLALDVMQDAIVKAISKLYSLKNEEYVTTWFYRILINQCLTTVKKDKKIKQYFLNIDDYVIDWQDKDISNTVDLYKAIDQLSPKIKTTIVLRFFEDRKLEEIAQITNTNLSTVKSRLYKGLEELKINIKEDLG